MCSAALWAVEWTEVTEGKYRGTGRVHDWGFYTYRFRHAHLSDDRLFPRLPSNPRQLGSAVSQKVDLKHLP